MEKIDEFFRIRAELWDKVKEWPSLWSSVSKVIVRSSGGALPISKMLRWKLFCFVPRVNLYYALLSF